MDHQEKSSKREVAKVEEKGLPATAAYEYTVVENSKRKVDKQTEGEGYMRTNHLDQAPLYITTSSNDDDHHDSNGDDTYHDVDLDNSMNTDAMPTTTTRIKR